MKFRLSGIGHAAKLEGYYEKVCRLRWQTPATWSANPCHFAKGRKILRFLSILLQS